MSASHVVCVLVPVKIISEANGRENWRRVAERKKMHRTAARAMLQAHARPMHGGPVLIAMTRIAPRTLDDDNLVSGFKATRDGVSDWLGIDDGDKRLSWSYDQRKGNPGQYAAEVLVEWES